MHIKEEFIFEKIIEKSRFICYLNYCPDETFFKEYLNQIKKKHYDATHVCSACIIDNIKRSNDDNEPSGTAGIPILSALENNNLNHTLAIVVRYFGGIKLGTGGLIRAYGGTTNEAIKNTKIYDFINYQKYQLVLDYTLSNKIDYFLSSNTIILSKEYQEEVTYIFLCNDNNILDKINEYTKGNKLIHQGEEYTEVMI